MEFDIELGVATMFRDATMQSIVPELRTEADWDRFNNIKDTAKQRTKEEVDDFERDKPQRLVEARKDLIDKAGSLTLEHPTPFGTDKFEKSAIERQAASKITNDHQARLLGIKSEETEAYSNLKQSIHTREGVQDQARDAFARTTDRQKGEHQRMPTRDR
ncbi:MAG: hypothetical protein L3J16_00465 [Anaerolineales bacterium]|nr:hypothetical protein [Anaerolineales bacterium]